MRWPDIFFKPKRKPDSLADDAPEAAPSAEAEAAEEVKKLPVSQVALPPAPVHSVLGDTEVIKDMAEADTLRQLSRSGGVRLIKRDFFLTAPKAEPVAPVVEAADASIDIQKIAPVPVEEPVESPPAQRPPPSINLSGRRDDVSPSSTSGTAIFKRRTKMADVARIVLPPRREETPAAPSSPLAETKPLPPIVEPPPKPESTATIFPATFPVSVPTGSVLQSELTSFEQSASPVSDAEAEAIESSVLPVIEQPISDAVESKTEADGNADSPQQPEETPSSFSEPSSLPVVPAPETTEKQEFILSNGERILGHILSETPESIYLNHATLGVLTIPRAQIAQRPVEIILMNGDRIVGDILAETADSLFVRHASLGVLTVPKNQRSSRVVEAILKDGDRILGEVLGETGNFTVIRSATLGTVAVPHNRVAMLNRRAEEVQMKALPPAETAAKNQP